MKAASFVNLRKCFPTLTEPTVMILSVGVLLEGKNQFFDTNRKD